MLPHDLPIWQQMMSGDPYYAYDSNLGAELHRVRQLVWQYNQTPASERQRLSAMLRDLLGECGDNVEFLQPFHCDFGKNIKVGNNVYANFNLTILDEGLVAIGDNVFIGPNVSILTPCHPIEAPERNRGIQWTRPVTIGDNCWIGASVTILPGVTIGHDVVIGAGSLVAHDIPSRTVALGNPARVTKTLLSKT